MGHSMLILLILVYRYTSYFSQWYALLVEVGEWQSWQGFLQLGATRKPWQVRLP